MVDMVFQVFIGALYPSPAWKVFFAAREVPQKIFFRWLLCTFFLLWVMERGYPVLLDIARPATVLAHKCDIHSLSREYQSIREKLKGNN